MKKVTDYLTENDEYLDKNSAIFIEELTDQQFNVLIAANDAFNGAYPKGSSNPGIDCKLVKTTETLAEFDDARTNHWQECALREEVHIGVPAIKYERVQTHKGRQRQNILVVDFGDFRVTLT